VECEAAIERGCPNDTGPGAYSYLVAPDVGALPKTLTVHHCGSPVLKWLKVELPAGMKLMIKCPGYLGTGLNVELGRLREGEREPDVFDSIPLSPKFMRASKTIVTAGTYYLRIDLDGADAPLDLQLELSTMSP
jgi:hypothetical protein